MATQCSVSVRLPAAKNLAIEEQSSVLASTDSSRGRQENPILSAVTAMRVEQVGLRARGRALRSGDDPLFYLSAVPP
jgi:hypothetical protein